MSADSQGPPDSPDSQGPRLDSWKEIAAYLNRHVTTVRRWEKHEGLPVHRHVHDKLGSVYTFREELDDWWRSRRLHLEQQHNGETVPIADRLDEPPPDATTTPSQEIGDEWRAAVRVDPESYVRSGAIRNLQRRFWIVGSVLLLALGSLVGTKLWQSRPTTAQATLPRSLAVLPFKPLLARGGDELLQAAMTEAVINKLSQIPSIRVEPFARVRRYGDLRSGPPCSGTRAGRRRGLGRLFPPHREPRARACPTASNLERKGACDERMERRVHRHAAGPEPGCGKRGSCPRAGIEPRANGWRSPAGHGQPRGVPALLIRQISLGCPGVPTHGPSGARVPGGDPIRSRLRPRVFRSRFGPPGRSLARWTTGHRRVTTGKGGCPESSGHRRIHRSGALGAR